MSLLIKDDSIVTPGELIATGNEFQKGNGVFKEGENFYSKLVGVVFIKDREIRVRPLKGRYYPKVGDKVIGIIEETGLTNWNVDIKGPYRGVLLASNAVKRKFDPIKDDARRIYDIGDIVRAEIISFDWTKDPMLSTQFPNLGKLRGGRIIEINPNHIPRVIGRKGSMLNKIKKATDTKITVAQNGLVWIKGENSENEELVVETINMITKQAHTNGLTDRVSAFLSDKQSKEDKKE